MGDKRGSIEGCAGRFEAARESCDVRTADVVDMGVAPFYFYGRDRGSEYEVIPPLLHYYSYSDQGNKETNLWGPLLWQRDRHGGVFNVMPFFWQRSMTATTSFQRLVSSARM